METTDFKTKKELFDFMVANKQLLITQKKAELKRADAIVFTPEVVFHKPDVDKELNDREPEEQDNQTILVKVVINTTNIIDSHMDMHLDGIWKKSLSENKMLMHLQEHQMKFDHVISDGSDLKAYAKTMSWLSLGYNYNGSTEALVFESKIKKDRNEFMFEQYQKGYVKNHSVGMRYVQLVMCIDDKDYGAEYEAWQRYYPLAVNKEVADDRGYFWVVKEAKVIEGSAVLCGSNQATPTLSVGELKQQETDEPSQGTHEEIEPEQSTQKGDLLNYLFTNLKFN